MGSSLKQEFRSLGTAFLDILYPRHCENCSKNMDQTQKGYLCEPCLGQIRRIPAGACQGCAKTFSDDYSSAERPFCPQCSRTERCFNHCYAMTVYEGIVKKLIHAFKFSRAEYLSSTLQSLLIRFLENDFRIDWKSVNIILPIPLHPKKQKERGFNQSETLAEALHRRHKIPSNSKILLRRKYSEGQTLQHKKERWENIRGSFETRPGKNLHG
jgi:competence protein ComFC